MAKRSPAEAPPEPKQPRKPKGSGLVLSGVPRVNLLPASEVRRRAAVVLAGRWVAGLVATAMVVAGLVVAANWERGLANQQLAAEHARTLDLNGELASLSHVSQAFAERTALTELRAQAMGTDTEWRALLADLTSALPKGATLETVDLATGPNPLPDVEPGAGVGVIGRLSVGTDDPTDQQRMINRLRELELTLAADAGALNAAEDGRFSFVVEFVLDQTHYSGDHAIEGGVR